MKRMLFIASLPTPRKCFDGERNKSKDVLNCLSDSFSDTKISIIDLTKNQYIQTAKLILLSIFRKFDYVFISKCVVGGSFALHLYDIFSKKKRAKKVLFYLIGNGFEGFDVNNIYINDLKQCSHMIVESTLVQNSLVNDYHFNASIFSIFPCIKSQYDLEPILLDYSSDRPLRAIFFSRITEQKGVADAINAVIAINKKYNKIIYELDVSGGYSNEKSEIEYKDYIEKLCTDNDGICFLGTKLRANGIEAYKKIQQYDLHIFPSYFFQECAPGSIVDMMIAGVPTLSSAFPSVKDILSEKNSYFFTQGDFNDLVDKMEYIYLHKNELNDKRKQTHVLYEKYTPKAFLKVLKVNGFLETEDNQ